MAPITRRIIGAPRRLKATTTAAAIVVTALGVTSCSQTTTGGAADGGGTDPSGGQLVIGVSNEILSLDPGLAPSGGRETIAVRNLVFDTLVKQGNDLRPAPRLAKSWSNPDSHTWIFKLRNGIKFTNGEPFNAQVAKYNIERVLDPSLKLYYYSQLSAMVKSVEAPDETTLKITTKGAAPGLLTVLAYMQIVPEKYMKKVGDEKFNKKPIGTGPFTFQKRQGDKVYLTRNANYWGGQPHLKSVVFQTIPEVSSRVAALKSGAIQIASEIPADLSKSLTGSVEPVSTPGTRIYFLGMNVKRAPFNDVKVRRAIASAINRKAIVKNLYEGKAKALNQDAFPAMLGYQKKIEGYTFNQSKAGKVLRHVNTPIVIDVQQSDLTLAQAIMGQLQAVGLKVKVQTVEDGAFKTKVQAGKEQAYLSSWGVAEGDLDAVLIRHFVSSRGAQSKYTNYSSSSLDKKIAREQSTVDAANRQKIFAGIMDQLIADSPWAPIITPDEIYGVSTSVSGWQPSPIGLYFLKDAKLSNS